MLGLFILYMVFPAVLLLSAGLNRGYDWIKKSSAQCANTVTEPI